MHSEQKSSRSNLIRGHGLPSRQLRGDTAFPTLLLQSGCSRLGFSQIVCSNYDIFSVVYYEFFAEQFMQTVQKKLIRFTLTLLFGQVIGLIWRGVLEGLKNRNRFFK